MRCMTVVLICVSFLLGAMYGVAHGEGTRMRASFYGRGLEGEKTASGEKFDADAPTAAHRTFRLGTKLKVVNPENGRSVTVRVNDRGPRDRDRDIDLSLGAAKSLGIVGEGVHEVEVEELK
jgi:rare lipoprotein A